MHRYPEEKEKGMYATISLNLQALGSVIGGIIPVILNKDAQTSAGMNFPSQPTWGPASNTRLTFVSGVPTGVYATFMVLMGLAAILSLFLLPPEKLVRDDGSRVAAALPRTAKQEILANL
jgi:hypothetical protein